MQKTCPSAVSGANNPFSTSYMPFQNLKFFVIIVGWLGIIASSVLLCSSLLTIKLQSDVEQLLQECFFKGLTGKEQQFLMNLLATFSTITYGISLINTGISLLLLIGVYTDSGALLYAWLIFQGISFGVSLYFAIFCGIAGLFMDLFIFLLWFLVFPIVVAIFYKIYLEVFILVVVIRQQKNSTWQKRSKAVYLPS